MALGKTPKNDKPAREIGPSRIANTGYVAGSDGHVAIESYLEASFLYLLRFDPEVESFKTQALTIPWTDEDGKSRKYTPDILVHYKSGPPELIEVKHTALLSRDREVLEKKFSAAQAYTQDKGWVFRLVTEDDIPEMLVINYRFLDRYRKSGLLPDSGISDRILSVLPVGVTTTPKALLELLCASDDAKALYLPYLWQLVATGEIYCDLSARITMSSTIRLART